MSAHAARPGLTGARRGRGWVLPWLGAGAGMTAALTALLAALAFVATGGLQLGPTTTVELLLTIGGALVIAAAIVLAPGGRPLYGSSATLGMLALAILTVVSVAWSVQPDDSWVEASRTFAYLATFAGAVALVRIAPQRWSSVLAGVMLSALVICGYALATKVFPGSLASGESYARLREPFGYWNAVGLTAAMAGPACLWLGARRTGHAAVNALAYPILGVLLVTLFVAYSRGALLVLALGSAFWFAAVPLRLRGAAVLAVSGAGAAGVVAWVFSKATLTKDHIPPDQRAAAGHDLGVLLLVLIAVLLAAGLAIGFFEARQRRSELLRRRTGLAILVALALVPVVLALGLAASSRGFTGSISHAWSSLTNPNARTPPNDPSRLTAIGSVRARYWRDALKIFGDHPALGVGAGGYATARARYRTDNLDVLHAHGYIVQTLADLGLVGLAVSLALLAVWLASAIRATRPFEFSVGWHREDWRRGPPSLYTPERIGLLTIFAIVVVFGFHSLIDWTWFIPGNACVALLCAGWLAGRGPLADARSAAPRDAEGGWRARTLAWREQPWRTVTAVAVVVFALIVGWSQLQPLRSVHAGNAALAALARNDLAGARADVHAAIAHDPLSVEPLFDLAVIDTQAHRLDAAKADLQRAVRLQPANATTWLRLAEFDLNARNDRHAALGDLGPVLYLDPQSVQGVSDYLGALRGAQTPAAPNPANPSFPTAPPASAPAGGTPAGTT